MSERFRVGGVGDEEPEVKVVDLVTGEEVDAPEIEARVRGLFDAAIRGANESLQDDLSEDAEVIPLFGTIDDLDS